jgi:hypothetical protein
MLGLLVYGGGEMVITFSQPTVSMAAVIIDMMMYGFIFLNLKFEIETYAWYNGQQRNLPCFGLFGVAIGG